MATEDNFSDDSKKNPDFDASAGSIWIYPTNQTVRDYQFDIVKTALFNNTLVSLPTGLGKTFIAAVVMYNYYRWFPNDIILFMAPTRPLVTQQLEACHNIVGIPATQTVELTGHIPQKKRDELWKNKKVFFLTPQVMASDLSRGACPVQNVRCVVFDEAHKATGNHAYVQVISSLTSKQNPPFFRVLALSATPGKDISAVQQVITKLLISRVEIRSEDSSDIMPYTHQKMVETVVVDLPDYMKGFRRSLLEVFQFYTGKLMKQNIIFGRDGSSFTQYQLLKFRENFRANPPATVALHQRGYVEGDFATSISLAKALELLDIHSLLSCYNFLQGILSGERSNSMVSAELRKNRSLCSMMNEIKKILQIKTQSPSLNSSALFTTFSNSNAQSSHLVPRASEETDHTLSHPKMGALKDIVTKHFQTLSKSKVIIFSKFRDSVEEIGTLLETLRPLVRPMVFIGQSKSGGGTAGFNQKRQKEVLQQFRAGDFNVLVATSVGEEGLDIGEVDLIICYDACGSPTRLVQRMGRTGRQRKGTIVFLLTEGKEQMTYNSGVSMQKSINKSLTDVTKLQPYLYKSSPRMIPAGVEPVCYKMNIVLSTERDDYNKEVSKKGTNESIPKKRAAPATVTTADISFPKKSRLKTCVPGPSTKPYSQTIGSKTDEKNSKKGDAINEDGGGGYMDLEFVNFGTEAPSLDSERNLFLSELFLIHDSAQSFGPCLFVSSPSGLPKIVAGDDSHPRRINVVSENSELEELREALEAMVLVGSEDGKCGCGNANSHLTDSCPSPSRENIQPNKSLFQEGKTDSKSLQTSNSEDADVALLFEDVNPFEDDDKKSCDPLEDGADDWMSRIDDDVLQDNCPPRDENNGLGGASENMKTTRLTRTQMIELFVDDQLLFEEDEDYTASDCSTTSNEDFGSPIRREKKDLPTVGRDTVVFPEIGKQPLPKADASSSSREDSFAEPDVTNENQSNMAFLEASLRMLSSPNKPEKEAAEGESDGLPELEDWSSSPDLSQFRMENRIKNSNVPNQFFQTYSSIMSPANNSAEILNEFLGSMRVKNDQNQSVRDDLLAPSTSAVKQAPSFSADAISPIANTPNNNQSKRSFTFKKRSNVLRMSPELSSGAGAPILASSPIPIKKSNVSSNMGCSALPIPPGTQENLAKKKVNVHSTKDLVSESGLLYGYLSSAKRYGSGDIMEYDSGSNDSEWENLDAQRRNKEDAEQARIREMIEEKRLQAMQIRSNKMQAGEDYHLQEIKPVNFKLPSVLRGLFDLPAKNITLPMPRFPTNDPENVPSSSATVATHGAARNDKSMRETKFEHGFSDDDDFDFVKPQRKYAKVDVEWEANTSRKSSQRDVRDVYQLPVKRKLAKPRNPYVEYEADVSGGSSDGSSEDEYANEGFDLDDSFVTQNFDETVTYSQQAHYAESVKDVIPVPFGRIERPLSPAPANLNHSESYYEEGDSFCVPNDEEVEYSDVGIFTQAMQQAKTDLEKDDGKRVTRNERRRKMRDPSCAPDKRRRRVYTLEDSSDED